MTFPSKTKAEGRILDWDIENRPLTYMGNDYTSAEITAICASWVGSDKVYVWVLEPPPNHETSALHMLVEFRRLYDRADIVTGHYIRKHDLPMVNAHMLEYGLAPLAAKLTSDTCLDLTKKKDFSGSQESLAGALGLPEPKHHMDQTAWRSANRLTPEGIAFTKKRCRDDVIQHKALREALIEQDALGTPKLWRPYR